MASASVAVAQATRQKIDHVLEDGESVAKESINTNINDEEDRKSVAASKGAQQSSLSVAKADGEPAITSVLSNSIVDMSARPQQHLIPLPKHQQQQMQQHLAFSRSKPSVSGNSFGIHPESLPGGSTNTKFPHGLMCPQAFIQGGSPLQWPQGKPSAGRGVDPVGASPAAPVGASPATPVVKYSFLQLQSRTSQQSLPSQAHQTQISFGMDGNKQGGQHHSVACSSPPSSATDAIGSPSNSISKSASGSPRVSAKIQYAQSNASSAQYYQKRPAEHTRQIQQHQQHNSVPSTSSTFSLCAPLALTLAGVPAAWDPTKAMAVNSMAAANSLKGLAPTSFLNAAQLAVAAQPASASPRPPISATISYMSLPPFSAKPSAEQKPTAGIDNLHACWQPEKR